MFEMERVLSVDWDFFFPDVWQWDWGHREEGLFLELLWAVRPSNRHLFTGEVAVEVVHPDPKLLDGFWEKVVGERNPERLVIVDSHSDMHTILEAWGGAREVVNFDQHHDLGYSYSLKSAGVDCGNWASMCMQEGLLDGYDLWYPPWRKDAEESELPEGFEPGYGLPDKPSDFDMIFICRSSAWSPTWSDDKWIEFVEYWKERDPILWKLRVSLDFVQKERHPTLAEAVVLRQEADEQLAEMRRSYDG